MAVKSLKGNIIHTNNDALIGSHALVIKRIDADHMGEVRIKNQIWSASSLHNLTLEEGEYGEVVVIEGAHLVVRRVTSMLGFIIMILLIAIVVILIFSTVKIVPQSYAYVVERIGAYDRTLNVGLHILIPLIDRVSNRVSLKNGLWTLLHSQLLLKIMLQCRLIQLSISLSQI